MKPNVLANVGFRGLNPTYKNSGLNFALTLANKPPTMRDWLSLNGGRSPREK
ncbi:MAG: hypothetical protein KME27_06615 [Lyngbya sp. HA4199-MV5]|nr:hypothetical protein [Lyngbya sp. HA4199-MV5]